MMFWKLGKLGTLIKMMIMVFFRFLKPYPEEARGKN